MAISLDKKPVDKATMFSSKDVVINRRNFISNAYLAALVDYDVEKAKAYKGLMLDIKGLLKSIGGEEYLK